MMNIFRPVRALMFVSLGLFGVIPACHHLLVSGWHTAYIEAAMHRVFIQAGLYILGELLQGQHILFSFWEHSPSLLSDLVTQRRSFDKYGVRW